ncbi:MAG: hypothetical protein EXR62_17605 [Chloroflexi bacterium]|nr:hypothetical protein [Chloroflexota bacterium]
MILLNFSHPLTETMLVQLNALAQEPITQVVDAPAHFDAGQPFTPQALALVEGALQSGGLTGKDLQTRPVLVNPPSLNFITALLLAELHGRTGYFPAVVRIRPVAGSVPPRFEVAEILNLQAVREAARARR